MHTRLKFPLAFFAFAGLLALLPALHAAEPGRRPNILFILVDDQSPFDFKSYDPKSSLQTPNIGRLAEEGMVFNARVTWGAFNGAVCTPSRHMIMSVRTAWHLPVGPGASGHCPPNDGLQPPMEEPKPANRNRRTKSE